MVIFTVVGLVSDVDYHFACDFVKDAEKQTSESFDVFEVSTKYMLEFEWDTYIKALIRDNDDAMSNFEGSVLIWCDEDIFGSFSAFKELVLQDKNYHALKPDYASYESTADLVYNAELLNRGHRYVFMEIEIAGEAAGNLLIELYDDKVPKTCTNFLSLCTGDAGVSKHHQEEFKLYYKGTTFHRLEPNGFIQGGDICYGKGNGGESIYGKVFDDENFSVSHATRGVVSMANEGPNTNRAQFFITLQPAASMDNKFVAFGQVIEGSDTLRKMEAVEANNEKPVKEIKIVECGEYKDYLRDNV